MLKLEKAKRDAQKAEQKVVKAQANLVASRNHVQALEEKLAQARSSQQSSHADASRADFALQQELPDLNGHAQDNAQEQNDAQEDSSQAPSTSSTPSEQSEPTSPPENQVILLPPAEGRTDVGQTQEVEAPQDEGHALEQSSSEEANQPGEEANQS